MESLTLITRFNYFIRKRNLLAHISIWTIVILVLICSLTVFSGTLIGIVYLAFFLAFLLTFQSSYCLWARTIKFYCILFIIYSATVTAILFAFQLDIVHQLLNEFLSSEELRDIGLVYKPNDFNAYTGCFVSTILFLITFVYLGVFHDDFHRFMYLAAEEDISLSTPLTDGQIVMQQSINDSTYIKLISNSTGSGSPPSPLPPAQTTVLIEGPNGSQSTNVDDGRPEKPSKRFDWQLFVGATLKYTWRIVEIHFIKVVIFFIFRLAIVDRCLINFPFLLLVIVALKCPSVENCTCVTASWFIAFIIIVRELNGLDNLIYDPTKTPANCSIPLDAGDPGSWNTYLGLSTPVGEHIVVLILITAYSFIMIHRTTKTDKDYELSFGVIFPGFGRREADRSISGAIKYFFNFGFYQFGIEITCLTMVIAISHRLDAMAASYGLILIMVSITTSKRTIASVWSILSALISLLVLAQYLLVLGLPQPLCIQYPWSDLERNSKRWLYLSDYQVQQDADFLLYDFLVLLAISRQALVFWHTRTNFSPSHQSYESEQFRTRYLPTTDEFTIEDYFTNGTTPIKFFKTTFFSSIYWITLTAVLVAGATKISLFSLGYLVGCFIFLWLGNDAYLMTIPRLIFSWNWFVLYATLLVQIKVILQFVTCHSQFVIHCNVLKLLRVRCYMPIPDNQKSVTANDECNLSGFDEMDIVWDGVCFMFLLMQRVIFSSRYFRYLIQEVKAQHILASRGAELIMATQVEEAKAQAAYEKEVMRSIRQKMDDLRTDNEATSKAWQRLLSLPHHFQIIRNADRHLFSSKLDETLDHHRAAVWSYKRSSIPDPLGDELEKLAEMNGVNAVFTRWMKGEPIYDKKSNVSLRPLKTSTHQRDQIQRAQTVDAIQDIPTSPSTSAEVPTQNYESTSFDSLSDSSDSESSQGCCNLLNCLAYSLLLSATVKLNKLSKSYRYVSRRMDAEKNLLKKQFNLDYERFKRDQVWRKSVINTISENYARTSTDSLNLRLNMFTQFCRALGYVVVSNTSLWCQVLIIINQVYSTSLLSLPLPLLTFLWGTLSVPRPTKRFWKTVITITELVIVIKYVCSFPIWDKYIDKNNVYPFSPANLLGIAGGGQGSAIVLDLILLWALFFHRSKLKSLGQWNATPDHRSSLDLRTVGSDETQPAKTEGDVNTNPAEPEAIHQSLQLSEDPDTQQENKLVRSVEIRPTQTFDEFIHESYQHQNSDLDCFNNGNDTPPSSFLARAYQRVYRSIKLFFDHVLNTPNKVPTDVYTGMFICDFINFLILIYGFWAFGIGYTNQSVTSFINENKIPTSVLFVLLLQFASIMIDRYLYLQKNIRAKLLFQVLLVLSIHTWLFIVLPAITGHNLTFRENWPPKLFYIFKCIYFLLSAQQTRCGYPRRVLGYCFTKGFGYTNLISIKLYRAIPLLYDLRLYMDWIWTQTTLEFRNWYIMEDMFANLFIRKCELTIEEEYPTPRATPQSRFSKYTTGGLFILLIILIIWGPLLLFSMGKTVGESNPPIEFEYQLEFVGFEPILKIRASSSQINSINDTRYDQMKSGFPSFVSQTFLGDYKSNDVRVIHLFRESSAIWSISPPSKKILKEKISKNETITLKSTFSIYRRKRSSKSVDATISGTIERDVNNSTEFKDMLDAPSLSNDPSPKHVLTPPIFPNFIRVPESGQISTVEALYQSDQPGRSLKLAYIKNSATDPSDESETWWNANNNFTDDNDPFKFWPNNGGYEVKHDDNLAVVAFNDRIFTGLLALLSAFGIIGLYTTFVVFVARLIRNEPAGKVIYTELPNVDRFYGLIMDIYMTRECGEFELEEKLFAKLLYLYRSPELLIEWSKREDKVAIES